MEYIERIKRGEEIFWENSKRGKGNKSDLGLNFAGVLEAENILRKFAPYILKEFPETISTKGIIESKLTEIQNMKQLLNDKYNSNIEGRLFLKQDNDLAVAGSVKARGGIYEILKYTNDLLIENNLIKEDEDYSKISSKEIKDFLSRYKIQVGSTGNLGLSIGIISRVLGYKATVHMSRDAASWKKKLLRSFGAEVVEYEGDYLKAVENGRKLSQNDKFSYFVDDENSLSLFYGYASSSFRLFKQILKLDIKVNKDSPLFVYIPCGVGGAPGGITYGLKEIFGDDVHVFFVEPTMSPCMLLGMETGKHNKISIYDLGLSGITLADGLAVGRASGFVGKIMDEMLSGIFTISDKFLFEYMRDLKKSEDIFIEPSSAAAFQGVAKFLENEELKKYLNKNIHTDKKNINHIIWSTGGRLVPENLRKEYLNKFL
ncbi:MAG: D-serine ammonia-lyase [Lagierella massiliensis]|nr:D-serine ammonia-lyase [Lagierella massiliensis]